MVDETKVRFTTKEEYINSFDWYELEYVPPIKDLKAIENIESI